jgi:hypothetical protein|tara:strand:- start:703 stop:933 length:231 start_codon:yes stop_codon:yes gene_type:complete
MKIQTMSLVVGGDSCNASCPYCVSRMNLSALELGVSKESDFSNDLAILTGDVEFGMAMPHDDGLFRKRLATGELVA